MLKLSGKLESAGLLFELLGEPAGLSFRLGEDGFVEFQTLEECRSRILRNGLLTVIEDDDVTAMVQLRDTSLHFGKFGKTQDLSVINAYGINQGAPGIGTIIAFHEIYENYIAHVQGWGVLYGTAHTAAYDYERNVARELIAWDGGRVASVALAESGINTGYVLDMENYFVQLTTKPSNQWGNGRFAAEMCGREHVSTINIPLVPAGQRVDPALLTEVVSWLTEVPTSTARITGLYMNDRDAMNAVRRSQAVRNAIDVALDADDYQDGQGIALKGITQKGEGAELRARRAWLDNTKMELFPQGGVRVRIEKPA